MGEKIGILKGYTNLGIDLNSKQKKEGTRRSIAIELTDETGCPDELKGGGGGVSMTPKKPS